MATTARWDFTYSPSSAKIAALISMRPRTLPELSRLTGITVQGVIKQLRGLEREGLVESRKVKGPGLAVRRVYLAKDFRFWDFSDRAMKVMKLTKRAGLEVRRGGSVDELELLSEEALLQRRRVREVSKKLGREIDELFEVESRIESMLDGLPLDDEDRLVLQTFFSEDTGEDAERVIREEYGLDGRRSIDKALSKARRIDKK